VAGAEDEAGAGAAAAELGGGATAVDEAGAGLGAVEGAVEEEEEVEHPLIIKIQTIITEKRIKNNFFISFFLLFLF